MCDPDTCTTFDLYDRVVNVRLGAGVPVGTRGTIVGIMYNRNHFDTYYEVLFDNLPLNSLDAILNGKNQSKCRIKVHSYHLMNYSHSLRLRSVMYHPQRSIPAGYNWEQYAVGYDSSDWQQSNYSNQRNTQEKSTRTKPKSAPPLTTDQRPQFAKTEPNVNKSPSETTVQDASLPPPSAENLPSQQIVFTSLHDKGSLQAPYTTAPLDSTREQMLLRAIQDSGQLQTPGEQALHPNTQLSYNLDPSGFAQTQYYQPACI